jgi:thiamine pyrophosphate-dependent acetolactate synthase large subunit-like protein/CDGSH-type Zn-finger protein/nitrite reductase/ring-hydroxylating ferredoxin subunit
MASEEAKKKPIIRCQKNGPYVVKDLADLSNWNGEQLPTYPVMSLCRCGQSKNIPDCDGTHVTVGFDSAKTTDGEWDYRKNYVGKKITIHDNRGICAHSRFCTDGLPSVWKMGVEPWIDADGAGVEEIIAIIKKCPSGALSYTVEDVEHRDQDRSPAIRLAKDGPCWVVGGIELQNEPRGEEASLEHYTLCRCGGSKNKPFCDGTHWHIGFKDEEAGTEEPDPKETIAQQDSTTPLTESADAEGWVKVAEAAEIAEGQTLSVTVDGKAIVITHYNGEFGALDSKCPHQRGPLNDGSIEAGLLRCPWHGWGFDPLTGEVVEGGHHDVPSYPVEVRDGGVYVRTAGEGESVVTISDVMVETMVNWGVTQVFGIVGHSNLGVAEAIRKQEAKGNLEYISVRHEGAASFACSAYAKLSGKPAACLTIAGPGATNLLTGLWDAKMDRAPVLALTGQVNTQVLGPGAFQEIDLAAAFRSVSTWSQTVLPTSNHAELMNLALKHATVKRDVAHLIFPDEVQGMEVDADQEASDPTGRIAPTSIAPPDESLEKAVTRISAAMRPAIIVGYGAKTAMDRVINLAERLGAPIITTFKAKGQISDRHPHAAGVLGRSGTPVAANSMNEADLLIVFGASFSDHTGISQLKPTIQVDSERLALGKSHPVDVPVWGDIGVTIDLLLERLPGELAATDQLIDLADRWAKWRKEKERRAAEDRGKGVNSAAIFAALTRQAPANAVIAVDVGNNTYSFGRYFECRNHVVLMSGYLGSIGFGFPAAMGACAAAPGKSIIAVTGDGGFGQYLAEFTTAVKYGMNITTILLNNGEYGKISAEQKAIEMPVWQTGLHNPNFSQYAKNCGGYGVRVTKIEELDEAISAAIVHMGPAIVEIIADGELT